MTTAQTAKMLRRRKNRGKLKREIPLMLMLLPAVVIVFVYCYLPMAGIVMAFQKFNVVKSFWRSPFVGLDNFRYIFDMPYFIRALRNSFIIAFEKIVAGQVVPLLIALLLNEVEVSWFKRASQTAIFLPYFIGWAVLGGLVIQVFGLDGPINALLRALGHEPILFLGSNSWFRPVLIITDVWKGMGYNIIIFLAAITGIDPALYEAAAIDGCGKLKQTWHITLPGMLPIIVLVATLSIGSLLNAGFDQVFMLYNPLVYETGDIIDTYVYRIGLVDGKLAPSAAAGLFKSALSLVLVGTAYFSAYKLSDYRIF